MCICLKCLCKYYSMKMNMNIYIYIEYIVYYILSYTMNKYSTVNIDRAKKKKRVTHTLSTEKRL